MTTLPTGGGDSPLPEPSPIAGDIPTDQQPSKQRLTLQIINPRLQQTFQNMLHVVATLPTSVGGDYLLTEPSLNLMYS